MHEFRRTTESNPTLIGVKDARRAVVTFLGIVAAAAVAFIVLIATGRKTSPWHDGWFVFWVALLVVVTVLAIAATVPDFAEWLDSGVRAVRRRRPAKPQGPVTDKEQYTGDDIRVPGVSDHAVTAGHDVNVRADGGSVAAGVIYGNVTPPGPTPPGPAT